MERNQSDLQNMKKLSQLLDTKFNGPFGTKFGIDAIVGLIPGVGDIITSALSVFIVAQAAALGVGSATLVRMAFNIVVENVVDMIPLVGNLFDFYWKANTMNMKLIENHLANPARETIQSRMIVALICIILLGVLVASGYFSFLFLQAVYHFITANID